MVTLFLSSGRFVFIVFYFSPLFHSIWPHPLSLSKDSKLCLQETPLKFGESTQGSHHCTALPMIHSLELNPLLPFPPQRHFQWLCLSRCSLPSVCRISTLLPTLLSPQLSSLDCLALNPPNFCLFLSREI